MRCSRRRVLQLGGGFLLATGCGAAPSTEKRERLVFWTMQLKPTFEAYMAEVLATFAASPGGMAVTWVDVPWGEMEGQILRAVAGGSPPDVVNLNPQFASKLAAKGLLVNMGDRLSATEQQAYFPGLWLANRLGDRIFGLPWYIATDITIANRELLRAAGLPQPPQTYQELAIAAVTVRDRTGKFAFLPTMDGTQLLESMVQMGMNLWDDKGRAAFDTAKGRQAFQYWINLFQFGIIPRETLTEGHQRAIERYQAGDLVLVMGGPQFLRQIQENAPNIAAVTEIGPQIVGETGLRSAAVMNLVALQSSPKAEAAVALAQFLTNDANQLAFARIANTLPSTQKAAADPFFREEGDLLARARRISAEQLPQAAVLVPPSDRLDELRKILYEELQRAMLGEKDASRALTDAANRFNQLV